MSRKARFTYAIEALNPDLEAVEPTAVPEVIEVSAVVENQEEIEVLAVPAKLAGPTLPGVLATDALRNPEAYALPRQQRGRRAATDTTTEPRRTDIPREQLNVRIRPELKRAAAGIAGLQGMTLGDVVEAALIEYLKAAGR